MYFYKLILLEADESAQGLFKALQGAWNEEKHDLIGYLRNNLIGYASDGAAVMLGKNNGLGQVLNSWTTEDIYTVHCMAHRLHLAIRKGFKSVPYYKKFEHLVNEIHNFYFRHGHKRKAHLRELASVLNEHLYQLSYIFEVRWISSEFAALKRLNDSWHLLVLDLDSISMDSSFSESTRAQAKGLSRELKDKFFLLILEFTLDMLKNLSYWSKRLQQRAGILIGAEEYKEQMLASIEELATVSGSYLSFFLRSVTCSATVRRPCSLNEYTDSDTVLWQRIELLSNARSPPNLVSFRRKFVDELKYELNKYCLLYTSDAADD